VLQHFHRGWANGREMALTLDRFGSRLSDVQDVTDNEGHYHLLAVKIAAGKRVGYVRILVPQGLMTSTFSTTPLQMRSTPEELDVMRRVLKGIGNSLVPGRVEIATLDLSEDDIADIEVGDIVILENHQVSLAPTGIEGRGFVKIGLGQNGGLAGTLINDGESSRFEITEIVIQEEPPQEQQNMADGEEPLEQPIEHDDSVGDVPTDDNLAETEGLLRDVQAPVAVELGRIKLNTQQVAKLRPGQIMRLPRAPNDPVNLVINGKLFARGELIEVDGELGVRLIQVVGHG
jgi:type III secretion system YscQ/HrcQ family protein